MTSTRNRGIRRGCHISITIFITECVSWHKQSMLLLCDFFSLFAFFSLFRCCDVRMFITQKWTGIQFKWLKWQTCAACKSLELAKHSVFKPKAHKYTRQKVYVTKELNYINVQFHLKTFCFGFLLLLPPLFRRHSLAQIDYFVLLNLANTLFLVHIKVYSKTFAEKKIDCSQMVVQVLICVVQLEMAHYSLARVWFVRKVYYRFYDYCSLCAKD